MKVLIIEDSERLRRSLQHGLSRSGFAVEAVGDGREGLEWALHGDFDALILDLMLPTMDGLTVLRHLRQQASDLHVLVLTAKDRPMERVAGLDGGADDYLTKPFEFAELVARLRALGRRQYGCRNPVHEVGSLRVDLARRTATGERGDVDLTSAEFSLLEQLLLHRGMAVSKEQLLDRLYSGDEVASRNAIEVFVHNARRKLRDSGYPAVIRTRRGFGYVID